MPFLLNSQAQGVSGKNEQPTQTPWRRAPEARGPMQLHRLHRLKAGPAYSRPRLAYVNRNLGLILYPTEWYVYFDIVILLKAIAIYF